MGDGATTPVTTTGDRNWDATSSLWLDNNTNGAPWTTWVDSNDAVFHGGAMTITATENISANNITWSNAASALTFDSSADKTLSVNGSIVVDYAGSPRWFKFAGNFGGSFDVLSGVAHLQFINDANPAASTEITLNDPTNLTHVDFWNNISTPDMSDLTLNMNGSGVLLNLRQNGLTFGALNGNAVLSDGHDASSTVTINSLNPGIGASSAGIGSFTTDADDTINVTLGSGTHSFDVGAVGGVVSNDLLDVVGNVSGTITLGGTLSVALLGGELAAGKTFDLFDASSISGSFSSTSLPDISSYGLSWDTSQLGVDGTLSTVVATDTMHFGNGSENPITVTGTRNWDTTSSFWMPTNSGSGSYTTWVNGKDAVFYGGGGQTFTATESISVGDIYWSGAANGLQVGNSASTVTINGSITTGNPQWFKFGGGIAGTMDISDVLYFQLVGSVAFDPGTVITLDDPASLASVDFWNNIVSTDMTGLTINMNGQGDTLNLREDALNFGAINGNAEFLDNDNGMANVTIQSLSPGSGATSSGIGSFTEDAGDTINVTLGTGTHAFDVSAPSSADKLDLANGSVTYGGTLTVTLTGGSVSEGQTYDLFDAASFGGSFATINLPTLTSGLGWDTSSLTTDGTISIVRTAGAQDMYLDLNGTAVGFGIDNAASPVTVDPTAVTWNSDATGGSGGFIASLVSGDRAHFELSGTGNVRFDWENFAGTPLGGIITDVESGSPTVERLQKAGGGVEVLTWSSGAVFENSVDVPVHWDITFSNDFTKAGAGVMKLMDGSPKIDGICTISNGYIHVNSLGRVDADASFKFTDSNQLRFTGDLSGTATLGQLIGAGIIIKEGGSSLTAVTINSTGVVLTNSAAGEELRLGWGSELTLAGSAVTELDISKSGGTPSADWINVQWASQPLTLGGTLNVSLLAGSEALVAGDSFDLLSDTLVGSFSATNLPDISAYALEWDTSQLLVDGTISTKNIDFYLGDGATKPIVTTGTRAWDTTSTLWLPDNSAGGTYRTWSNGVNAYVVGDAPQANVSGAITVNNITATGMTSGQLVLEPQSASDSLTITGAIDASGRQVGVGGNDAGGTVGGDITVADVSRLQFVRGLTFAPGTTITSDDGNGDVQWWISASTDATDLTLNMKGNVVDFRQNDVVLGALNGSTAIRNSSATELDVSINSVNPGTALSSVGIGTFANDTADRVDLTLGSGTHAFDIGYAGSVASNDTVNMTANSQAGTITYGGTLNVTLLAGTLAAGATFDLFDADSFSGSFSAMNLPALTGELTWDTGGLATDGSIRVFEPSGSIFMFR